MKRLRLPPHITWPLFVVGLLSMSVATVTITVMASRSDGGAQVVEDYYQKAVNWDETAALQAASAALGWQIELTVAATSADEEGRPVEIMLRTRDGQPVDQARGAIRAFRPHRANVVAERTLVAVDGTPGLYRQTLPIQQTGLWDFEITATQDSLRFQTTIRKEIY